MKFSDFARNLLISAFGLVLFFGVLEFATHLLYPRKIKTYFNEQTERALGAPIRRKAPGEYRIFIFGGSYAFGFPVSDHYSIAIWLKKSFSLIFSEKKIEVINTAWPGKGSHHVVEGTHTVLKYHPDLFVIYSGHNDFPTTNRLYLDNWLYWLNLRLTYRSAFYRYLGKRLDQLRKYIVYHGHPGQVEKHYREEIIAQKVYKKIEIDDRDYDRILKRYLENMEEVIHLAKKHHVKVVFLNLPSNIHDIPPAASSHANGLTAEQRGDWDRAFQEGKKLQAKGKFKEAVAAYTQAAAIDSSYAELQFQLAICYERVGDYEAAKKAYTLARDLDCAPWRAKSSMNEAIRELCLKHHVIFVDIASSLERLSPHGIISSDLVYDNVHPSVKGQQIISDEILQALARNNQIAPAEKWDWESLEKAREASKDWKVEGSVNAYRYILKGLYLWGEQRYAEAIADLKKGQELMPNFIESYAFLGDAYFHMGQQGKALEAFQMLAEKDSALSEFLMKRYPEIQQSYSHIMQVAETSRK